MYPDRFGLHFRGRKYQYTAVTFSSEQLMACHRPNCYLIVYRNRRCHVVCRIVSVYTTPDSPISTYYIQSYLNSLLLKSLCICIHRQLLRVNIYKKIINIQRKTSNFASFQLLMVALSRNRSNQHTFKRVSTVRKLIHSNLSTSGGNSIS